jgi:hypothetical protein
MTPMPYLERTSLGAPFIFEAAGRVACRFVSDGGIIESEVPARFPPFSLFPLCARALV